MEQVRAQLNRDVRDAQMIAKMSSTAWQDEKIQLVPVKTCLSDLVPLKQEIGDGLQSCSVDQNTNCSITDELFLR